MRRYNQDPKSRSRVRDWHRTLAPDSPTALGKSLRARLAAALKRSYKPGAVPAGSSVDDLGCSIADFRTYMEAQFESGMTWENRGKGPGTWQIEHTKALGLFNLTKRDEFLQAAHFSNMRPLWYEPHLLKTAQDIRDIRAAKAALKARKRKRPIQFTFTGLKFLPKTTVVLSDRQVHVWTTVRQAA